MSAPAAPPLAPRDAYRLWAPAYEAETAVSFLDDRLVAELGPPLHGVRLLDAGCGTARRLRAARGPALAVGADLTWEMLAAGRRGDGDVDRDEDENEDVDGIGNEDGDVDGDVDGDGDGDRNADGDGGCAPLLAAADVRALPFADASFDVVWCRLVIGHVPRLDEVYAELARVTRPGGAAIVTDFHPAAARAGHTRSFRGADGRTHAVEHHLHEVEDHVHWAAEAGLELADWRDGVVGPELRPFYAAAGRLDRYAADAGLPVVLALSFRRIG